MVAKGAKYMSKGIDFKSIDNSMNIPRIGGESLLPNDIGWPVNPNGENLTFIMNLPTNFLNETHQFNYPEDKTISVFTTYNKGYFLDLIGYHGDEDELEGIKDGFTKVIMHSVGTLRNESEFLIPAKEIILGEEVVELDYFRGSLIGENPVFLQNEQLALGDYRFCLQIYEGDFPEEFGTIFNLGDSVGYLYLNEEVSEDIGLFFTQCT